MPSSIPLDKTLSVRYEQIVTNELNFVAQFLSKQFPAFPIVFGTTVFDCDDWVFINPCSKQVNELSGSEGFAFAFKVVFAVFEELSGSNVHTQEYVNAWFVASFFDRCDDCCDCFFVGSEVRSESAFVAYSCVQAFFFQTDFRLWKISAPMRRASLKVGAPTGRTMNS